MAKSHPVVKTTYIKGSNGSKPTPKVIPPKPVNFEITQSTGLFPAVKK
jgi:hypothetical protein